MGLHSLAKAGFEITTKILSCDRARFRARQNWLSCTIVHESCATKIVRDKNRARQKSRRNWVLIQNNLDYLCLKYTNFTKLDHLEIILINFSAFLGKNYYFTSKNAPKIVDSAKKSCTTKILSWKSCESCTISVVISNPGLDDVKWKELMPFSLPR